MVNWQIALLLLITGFCIGAAKIIFSLKGDLPDILTTLFLSMGWFQGATYAVIWIEVIMGEALRDTAQSAFIGCSSLILSVASYYCLQIINHKYQVGK